MVNWSTKWEDMITVLDIPEASSPGPDIPEARSGVLVNPKLSITLLVYSLLAEV